MTNVSLKVEETDSADTFKVSGRGELHLSILIETMRRQGYEFQVSPPTVIYKRDEEGKLLEPIELLMIEVPEEYVGVVMERLGSRHAEIKNMGTRQGGTSHLEFLIPARGLLGYRSQFMTDTNGNGIMNHVFHGYEEYKGEIEQRSTGSIIAHETGEATGSHSRFAAATVFPSASIISPRTDILPSTALSLRSVSSVLTRQVSVSVFFGIA